MREQRQVSEISVGLLNRVPKFRRKEPINYELFGFVHPTLVDADGQFMKDLEPYIAMTCHH